MTGRTYNDAIDKLNSLQTPYAVLKQRRDAGIRIDKTANEEMRRCLDRLGYTQADLERLNIVHVAGTKGKGSTCAYVNSIFAQYQKSRGLPSRIGLFTSPHLIAVRERIRINSAPISAESFSKYFFEVWDKLSAEPALEKPVYFRYLTLMSYHVFIQEKVETAIYEVGVGGEYDSTNIVDRPAVTGISTLGIDHTFALGDTIESIAWHKAGIQKNGVPSFTVRQKPTALEVVEKRAEERGVKSINVLELDPRLDGVKIRPDADFQKSNASLAIALAGTVMQKLDPEFAPRDPLPKEFIDGLEQVVWRGRCEKKAEGNITWYLDGAHTADSVVVVAKWFAGELSNSSGSRVLIFNQQGHREAIELLQNLYNAITKEKIVRFDHVIFCPTVQGDKGTKKDFVNNAYDQEAIAGLTLQKAFAEEWKQLDEGSSSPANIQVLPSMQDAFEYVRMLGSGGKEIAALITGSVHLIGTALAGLEDADAL